MPEFASRNASPALTTSPLENAETAGKTACSRQFRSGMQGTYSAAPTLRQAGSASWGFELRFTAKRKTFSSFSFSHPLDYRLRREAGGAGRFSSMTISLERLDRLFQFGALMT